MSPDVQDPTAVLDMLTGTWWPIISPIAVTILTGVFTKNAASKYVKQGAAIVFTAVFVVLSIIQAGVELDPGSIVVVFATYAPLAERTYRMVSATLGRSMNEVLAPGAGIGREQSDNDGSLPENMGGAPEYDQWADTAGGFPQPANDRYYVDETTGLLVDRETGYYVGPPYRQ